MEKYKYPTIDEKVNEFISDHKLKYNWDAIFFDRFFDLNQFTYQDFNFKPDSFQIKLELLYYKKFNIHAPDIFKKDILRYCLFIYNNIEKSEVIKKDLLCSILDKYSLLNFGLDLDYSDYYLINPVFKITCNLDPRIDSPNMKKMLIDLFYSILDRNVDEDFIINPMTQTSLFYVFNSLYLSDMKKESRLILDKRNIVKNDFESLFLELNVNSIFEHFFSQAFCRVKIFNEGFGGIKVSKKDHVAIFEELRFKFKQKTAQKLAA